MDHAGEGAAGPGYRLWLCELDEPEPRAPLLFHTVDELYQALLERWEQTNLKEKTRKR